MGCRRTVRPDTICPMVAVADLRGLSEPFAAMWEARVDYEDRPHRLTTRHPAVGEITLDCDIMTIHEGDLRAVVYTAEPGSIDAARLAATRARHTRLD